LFGSGALKLADLLVEQASKVQPAECARLLALNLAHCQALYGEAPLDEVLAALDAIEPTDDQAKLFAGGIENLSGCRVVFSVGWGKRNTSPLL